MLQKRWITTALACAVLLAGWAAGSELASAQSPDRLADKYAPLAGSERNATTLVSGLRDGSDFKLGTTSFKPPTGKMGYGNIDIALALAQAKLKDQGISNPTPAQLQSALIGDAKHPGVLALRAEGKGWGEIAHAMGYKVGEVMRHERIAREDKLERAARPERPEKPEKPERHGR